MASPTISMKANITGLFQTTVDDEYVDISALKTTVDSLANNQLYDPNLDLSVKLDKAGGTMTGFLTLHADPTNELHSSTKKYVDDEIVEAKQYAVTAANAAANAVKVQFLTKAQVDALPSGMTVQEAIDAHRGKLIYVAELSTGYLVVNALDIMGSTQLQLYPITRQTIDAIVTPLP